MSDEAIFDMVVLRCATIIDGVEYMTRRSVSHEDWEEAPQDLRDWYRAMLRHELANGVREQLEVSVDPASLSVEACGPPVRSGSESSKESSR